MGNSAKEAEIGGAETGGVVALAQQS